MPDRRSPVRVIATAIALVLLTFLTVLFVYEARRVLVWILIAAFFATALYPTVNWIQRRAPWCRRWLATLVVFVLVLAVIGGLVTLFVVPLVTEGGRLAEQLPGMVDDAREGRGTVGELLARFGVLEYIANNESQIREYASRLGAPTLAFLRGAATTVAGVLSIFVLAYLMVLEGPRIVDGSLSLFPAERGERIRRIGSECARTITGYLTGNLLISLICGVLTYVVLLLTGVPFAGLIALFVAIADLIPLIGATLGALVAVLAAFTHSTTAGIIVLVYVILYQQLENHLLQPVILSRTVQLNPLTVLVAILIATEMAGILGALLAIPAAGMIQVIVRNLWGGRRRPKEEPTAPADESTVGESAVGESTVGESADFDGSTTGGPGPATDTRPEGPLRPATADGPA